MQATQAVAAGDYSVRVELRGARGEVAEYIRSFNKMAEELGSVEMLQSDFVNTFSHEFKTPLISIRGFAKLLQNPDISGQQPGHLCRDHRPGIRTIGGYEHAYFGADPV